MTQFIPVFLALATSTILGVPHIIMVAQDELTSLPVSQEEIHTAVDFYGAMYSVSTSTLNAVIKNESNWSQYAKNINPPIETSYGLIQLNTLAHPEISKAQAYNPYFAINYLAKSISEGHGIWWSGYKKYVGGKGT